MANIIRVGVAGGSNIDKGINLNIGKITLTNGNIDTTATEYRYTDYFDCPQGNVVMDFGAIYGTSAGIVIYSDTGAYVDYYQANNRYRNLNVGQYFQSGYKARLSFPATAQEVVVLVDDTGNTVYSNFDNYHIGEGDEHDDVFGTLIHHIDFTDGVYQDKFFPKGTAVLASGVTASSNGITVTDSSSSYVTLPEFALLNGDTIVFDFGTWNWNKGSNNGRLLMYSNDSGLGYHGASEWNFYSNGWGTGFPQTDRNRFSNSKMGIKFVDNSTIKIYKDGVLEGTITHSGIWRLRLLTGGPSYFRINSAGGSGVGIVTIKSIKVYRGG